MGGENPLIAPTHHTLLFSFAGGAPLQWRVMVFRMSMKDAPLEWRAPAKD
jgi:hypothetical protein